MIDRSGTTVLRAFVSSMPEHCIVQEIVLFSKVLGIIVHKVVLNSKFLYNNVQEVVLYTKVLYIIVQEIVRYSTKFCTLLYMK